MNIFEKTHYRDQSAQKAIDTFEHNLQLAQVQMDQLSLLLSDDYDFDTTKSLQDLWQFDLFFDIVWDLSTSIGAFLYAGGTLDVEKISTIIVFLQDYSIWLHKLQAYLLASNFFAIDQVITEDSFNLSDKDIQRLLNTNEALVNHLTEIISKLHQGTDSQPKRTRSTFLTRIRQLFSR